MSDSTLDAETTERPPIDFTSLQRASASSRRSATPSPGRAPWWRRVLLGGDRASRGALREVSVADRLRIVGWALGLTPIARLRRARLREALDDGRQMPAAVGCARQAS